MNPYDRTAEAMKRQSEGPKRFAKNAVKIGAEAGLTAATVSFAPILAKAAPFLSKYIPEELAIKGLTKIHPKLGAFVKNAMDSGFDWNEAKDFLGKQIETSQGQESPDNAESPQETTKNPQENRNIIEQYSPELHQFIDQQIKGGKSLWNAGGEAHRNSKFKNIIKKITDEHKVPWTAILEMVYGGYKSPQSAQNGQQVQVPQQPQQGQPGKGEQALMSIITELNQKRRR